MQFLLKNILHFMPIIFGIGFLGPLLVQLIEISGWPTPMGVGPLAVGITMGGFWGIVAQVRGRWI